MKVLLLLCCIAVAAAVPEISSSLLRNDPTKGTTEGTDFALGFIQNEGVFTFNMYLSTSDPSGAVATIDFPNVDTPEPGFPMTVNVPASGTQKVSIPTSIAVESELDQLHGIRVTSDVPVGILGLNEQDFSTDSFLAFPCKDFKPADGSSSTPEYKYFVFSTITEGTERPFNSRFLIVACDMVNGVEIVTPAPGGTTSTTTVNLRPYQTFLVDRGGIDLTGTVITSTMPLAVFASHQCGQIPSRQTACDHLVEQVPPHVVFGQMFFAIPLAARESGDIFRVGSLLNDNMVTVTCNRRLANGNSERMTESGTIQTGGYYEFQTRRRLDEDNLNSLDYYRDFCCIETSKPAIVMQYSLSHSEDEVGYTGGMLGDPAMTLVPPVEQYTNRFTVNTFDAVRTEANPFLSFVSWAVSSEFFDPSIINDDRSFQVNGQPFLPASRTEEINTDRGSEEYVEIYCSNGRVCGYGAFSPLQQGDNYIEWVSSREENPAIFSSVYGFGDEVSYANPAGYQCEAIGLPHISIYDVTVLESAGSATIVFNRTGGDISGVSRVTARILPVPESEGGATEGEDYQPITIQPSGNRRIRWNENEVDPRMETPNDAPLTITIIDDDIAEPTEFVDVTFTVNRNGLAFPRLVARITILDDDGTTACTLVSSDVQVTEGRNAFVNIEVRNTDPASLADGGVGNACQLTTIAGSATGGSDYQILSNQAIDFGGQSSTNVRINIPDDNIAEATENFMVRLSSSSSDVDITGDDTATVTILDIDGVTIGFDPATYRVLENAGQASLTIVKNGMIDRDFTFSFATMDDTALAGSDYTSTSRPLTFGSSMNTLMVTVPIISDSTFEVDEDFFARISGASLSQVGFTADTATVTIDDPISATVQFNPTMYTVTEGGTGELVLELSVASTDPVTVQLSTQDGTAEGGADYNAISDQTVTFPPGMMRATVNVGTLTDSLTEGQESFTAVISSPTGADLGANTVATVFINDPIMVQFEPAEYTVDEGDSVTFTAVLSSVPSSPVTVDFSTEDGSAGAPDDYTTHSQTISFPAGIRTMTVTVATVEDSTSELTERFLGRLSNPSQGVLLGGQSVATVEILDDDDLVVEFDPVAYRIFEGGEVMLRAQLNRFADRDVTVDFATSDGTAEADSDYIPQSGTFTFLAGENETFVVQDTVPDSLVEPAEDFFVTLSNPSPTLSIGAAGRATITIDNNDILSIQFDPSSYTVTEGGDASLRVVLSNEVSTDVTVDIETTPGSAGNADFTPVTMTIRFPAGARESTVVVSTTEDVLAEPVEEFTASLTNPSLGFIGNNDTATVFIEDNDALAVRLEPASVTVTEGDQVTILAILNIASSEVVTVDFSTADGSAIGGPDYEGRSVTLTFQPGETQQQVFVNTEDDDLSEEQESFTGSLSNPSGDLQIGMPGETTVFINDNDALMVQFNPTAYSVDEGGNVQLTIQLNTISDREVTVELTTNDVSATEGTDYVGVTTPATVTFPAGVRQADFTITTLGDSVSELPETFQATLSNPSGGLQVGSGSTATVTINDDDPLVVQFMPDEYTIQEGETVVLMVSLNTEADREVRVNFTTVDGSATGGEDFMPTFMEVIFPAGTTMQVVSVSSVDDSIAESPESFTAVLMDPSESLVIGPMGSATVTINDDDELEVRFDPTTYSVNEGDSIMLTLRLSNPADQEVSVLVSNVDQSATSGLGGDYSAFSSRVTFPAGVTEGSLEVSTNQDDLSEGMEEFDAVLRDPSPRLRVGSDDEATVTIIDDDVVNINFNPTDYTVGEGDSGEITVELSTPSTETITVDVRLTPDTADANDDYVEPGVITLVFPPGQTQQTFTVTTVDDEINELDESFGAVLENPTGDDAIVGSARMATVNIQDDDPVTLNFERPAYTAEEGMEAPLTVVIDREADRPITFRLTTIDGTATAPGDFMGVDDTFTIPAGQRSVTVPITPVEDSLGEPNEQFEAEISEPSEGARIGTDDRTTVTIRDDALVVEIEEPSYRVPEGEGVIEICATLSNPATEEIQILASARETLPADAIDIDDFNAGQTTITFIPGETRSCASVSIVDDEIMEPLEEVFMVTLDEVVLRPIQPVFGTRRSVPVTIIDDDSTSVKIVQPEYTVNEGDGSLEVCVERLGASVEDITVTVLFREASPASAEDESDFLELNQTVTILASESQACTQVPIIDDNVAREGDETFEVTIIPPAGVPADPGPSVVTIIDNDVIRVSFDPDEVEVNEDVPSGEATVCIMGDTTSATPYTVTLGLEPSGTFPASLGDDYNIDESSLNVLFPAGAPVERCITVDIVNDTTYLEPQETVRVFFETLPIDVMAGPRPEAIVAIIDDDTDLPLTPDDVDGPEGDTEMFCIRKDADFAQQVVIRVDIIDASEQDDVTPSSFEITIPAEEARGCQDLQLRDDKIGLQDDKTFPIMLTVVEPSGAGNIVNPRSTLTIMDNDNIMVSLKKAGYTVEEGAGTVGTCVKLNCAAAKPISVTLQAEEATPPDAIDGEDFQSGSAVVVIPPGETRVCQDFTIIDDSVVETPMEEDFVVRITNVSPDMVDVGENSSTIVTIVDDDMLSVQLSERDYRVIENTEMVEVCVRRNGLSADDITVTVSSRQSSPESATANADFTPTSIDITIPSTESFACGTLPITDDDLGLEGDETFDVVLVTPPGIPSASDEPSTVIIVDDDVIEVVFTTPEVTVVENDTIGMTMVCFRSTSPSARPFNVRLSSSGSGTNPATPMVDYTVNPASLLVTVPAGAPPAGPLGICRNVGIVNDDIALEGDQTFQFIFEELNDGNGGVVRGDPSAADFTIIEDDLTVEIDFVSPDVSVEESNGTAFVCVERSAVTENELTIPIVVTTGTADTNDFGESSKTVTFLPEQTMKCTEIPIENDNTEEEPETFTVAFGSDIRMIAPGITTGMRAISTVTINDDDVSQCTISEPLMVNPFSDINQYSIMGGLCEIVALTSCGGAEPGFEVRVDFIGDMLNGAVGVFMMGGASWISRENGAVDFGDLVPSIVVGELNTLQFPERNVVIRTNESATTNVISVGGSINVDVVHNYGDGGSFSLSVGSGSSLLESCGICGTQSGQLRSLDGTIAMATNTEQRNAFVKSYRVPPTDMRLRPIRPACAQMDNDTIDNDPLFTCPINSTLSMCYEVHGRENTFFNLVSDTCVSINAFYSGINDLNFMTSIGARAVGYDGNCYNLQVDREECSLFAGSGNDTDLMVRTESFSRGGVRAYRGRNGRVRLSLPNCENVQLVLWVTCRSQNGVQFLEFTIARGLNLNPTAHGLLAQFWNIPITIDHYREKEYNVTIYPADSTPRSFLGDMYHLTWDGTREKCLYVGNGQGGPGGQRGFPQSVIRGHYMDYSMKSLFDTSFKFAKMSEEGILDIEKK